MSVEQVVDDYLAAARDLLGPTPPPAAPAPPRTGFNNLPAPDWTGNAHQAAVAASNALHQARKKLRRAAITAAEHTATAAGIAEQATLELAAITAEWNADKQALAALPDSAVREAALLAAAQQRLGEVVTLVAATTGRYTEQATQLRTQITALPKTEPASPSAEIEPATALSPDSPPAPPALPPSTAEDYLPGATGASAAELPTGMSDLAGMLPGLAGPAMAAPASMLPAAAGIPAAAASPLGSLRSLVSPASTLTSPTAAAAGAGHDPISGDFYAPGSLTQASTPGEVFTAVLAEAQRRGYSLQQGLACAATMLQESSGNLRAVSPNGLWVGPFQQDTSYAGRTNPNWAIAEFFNRLDDKGGPHSPDIWKSIFWLQQAPSAASAEAAYTGGRQAYLAEIQSQLPRATEMYRALVSTRHQTPGLQA